MLTLLLLGSEHVWVDCGSGFDHQEKEVFSALTTVPAQFLTESDPHQTHLPLSSSTGRAGGAG